MAKFKGYGPRPKDEAALTGRCRTHPDDRRAEPFDLARRRRRHQRRRHRARRRRPRPVGRCSCEKGDLAEGTSSRSGKLVHGGLRYLEYYEFRLVREALIEREVLLRAAPHIIWPMRFVLPHIAEQRPAWLDAPRPLPLRPSRRPRTPAAAPAASTSHRDPKARRSAPEFRRAFEYSDCWVDDARLVVLNALDAARARRHGPHAHGRSSAPPRGRPVAGRASQIRGTGARRTVARARARQRRRTLGRGRHRARRGAEFGAARAPRQGQPYRGARNSGTGRRPISSRTTTSASSSSILMRTISA